MCFLFAPELSGGGRLGRFLSGFLAAFWGLRVLLQLFYYDREVKRRYAAFNALFLAAYVYLTIVFAWSALRPAVGA
jgi:hypothetical protein